jgi:hypothetical protein
MTDRTYLFTVLDEPTAPSTLTQTQIDALFDSVSRYAIVFNADTDALPDEELVDFATITVSDGGPVRWHGAALTKAQTQHLFSQVVSRALHHAAIYDAL